MISTAAELAKHLVEDRQSSRILLDRIISDLGTDGITDSYMEILDNGWSAWRGSGILGEFFADVTGEDATYEYSIANPMIAVGADWQMPLEYSHDETVGCLHEMGASSSVTSSFARIMILECADLIEREGVNPPGSDPVMVDVFGRMAAEALTALEENPNVVEFDENDIAAEAAERIAQWVGDTIRSTGESIVLRVVLKMILEEMDKESR